MRAWIVRAAGGLEAETAINPAAKARDEAVKMILKKKLEFFMVHHDSEQRTPENLVVNTQSTSGTSKETVGFFAHGTDPCVMLSSTV